MRPKRLDAHVHINMSITFTINLPFFRFNQWLEACYCKYEIIDTLLILYVS